MNACETKIEDYTLKKAKEECSKHKSCKECVFSCDHQIGDISCTLQELCPEDWKL